MRRPPVPWPQKGCGWVARAPQPAPGALVLIQSSPPQNLLQHLPEKPLRLLRACWGAALHPRLLPTPLPLVAAAPCPQIAAPQLLPWERGRCGGSRSLLLLSEAPRGGFKCLHLSTARLQMRHPHPRCPHNAGEGARHPLLYGAGGAPQAAGWAEQRRGDLQGSSAAPSSCCKSSERGSGIFLCFLSFLFYFFLAGDVALKVTAGDGGWGPCPFCAARGGRGCSALLPQTPLNPNPAPRPALLCFGVLHGLTCTLPLLWALLE